MQWNGARPNPDRPAPLRSLMELLQQKVEPYVTQYGENQIAGSGPLWNSIVRSGTEMSPGVGDLLGAEDLQTAAQNNDWGGIGLGMLAAIPGIPSFSRGVKGEARAARGAVNAAADAAPARYAEPSSGAIEVEVLPPEPDYPIRAYHGSPHSFDRFSLDKIGTGEGAQAYGHGLYFAESEDVARSYRDALQQPALSLGGDVVADNPRLARMAKAYPSADGALQGARDQLARAENTLAASTDDLERMIAEADISEARATIADLEPYAGQWFDKTPTGSMYEVGINADPAAFMDWDAPIYRQPEPVRNVLREYGYDAPAAPAPIGDPALRRIVDEALRRGESPHDVGLMVDNEYDLYQQAQRLAQARGFGEVDGYGDFVEQEAADYLSALRTRESQNAGWAYNMAARDVPRAVPGGPAMPTQRAPEISERLREAGVPGIRYLDGGSRTAGEGSSNYVVFNDELVKILRKYGIGGLSTTVGASALAEELDRRGQAQEF